MRVEVAVVDGVAGGAVAVAGAAVGDLVGVAGARAYALGVHVVGVVVIGVEQPLVAVQVEHVLLVAVMGIADAHRIADVAVGDVGRLGREQGHAGLDPGAAFRRHLAGEDALQADVGRHIHLHGDVAHGMGAEEELLVGAGQAVVHGADAQAVGHHLGADAAGAVVDHEGVAGRLQHVAEHRVVPVTGEGLGHGVLVMEHRGEIAEGLQPVGQRRVALAVAFQRVGIGRKGAIVFRPHDHRVGVAGDDLAVVHHGDHRQAGLAFLGPGRGLRITRFVIDDRLAGRGAAGGGQAHFFLGDHVAVGARPFGQHHYLGEQAVGGVAAGALAAEGGAVAGSGEGALALGVERVAAAAAGRDQTVLVAAGVGGDVADVVHRLQAVDLEADMAIGDLLVLLEQRIVRVVRVGLVGQEVLQVDGQAVAGGHAQYQRTRALVRAQAHFAGNSCAALGERHFVAVHHVAAQGEHHAVDVLRAQAVEHQRLVQGDHVGHQVALALDRRLGVFAGKERAQQQQGAAQIKGCPRGTKAIGVCTVRRSSPVHLG
ncbi:hypothetical protein D3C78_857130 [compost metagenome]